MSEFEKYIINKAKVNDDVHDCIATGDIKTLMYIVITKLLNDITRRGIDIENISMDQLIEDYEASLSKKYNPIVVYA